MRVWMNFFDMEAVLETYLVVLFLENKKKAPLVLSKASSPCLGLVRSK